MVNNNSRWLQVLIVELVIIATLFLLQQVAGFFVQFAGVAMLFFLAWLLAFALSPLIKTLVRVGVPHGGAVVIVYVGLILVIVGLGVVIFPQLNNQLTALQQNWGTYMAQAERIVSNIQNWVRENTGQNVDLNSLYNQALAQAQAQAGNILSNAVGWLSTAASLMLNVIFLILISLYMAIDGERLANGLVKALPNVWHDELILLGNSIGRSFGGFLRGQLIFALIYGVLNAGIMIAFGLDYVLVASIIAGFCMLIPLVGNFLAFIPPILIALVTPEKAGQWWLVLIVLFIMQSIMMQLVGPRIMSSAVGIHPLFTFVAMLFGAQVAGIWGVLFGIPVAGVVALMSETLMQRLSTFFSAPTSAPVLSVVVAGTTTQLEGPPSTTPAPPSVAVTTSAPSGTTTVSARPPALLRGLNWLSSTARNRGKR